MNINPSELKFKVYDEKVEVPREIFFKIISFLEENNHFLASSLLLQTTDLRSKKEKELDRYKREQQEKEAGINGTETPEQYKDKWDEYQLKIPSKIEYPDWLFGEDAK